MQLKTFIFIFEPLSLGAVKTSLDWFIDQLELGKCQSYKTSFVVTDKNIACPCLFLMVVK